MVGYGRARRDSRLPPSGPSPIATASPGGRGRLSRGRQLSRRASRAARPRPWARHPTLWCPRAASTGEWRDARAWVLIRTSRRVVASCPRFTSSGPWISEFVLALPECPDREGSQPIPAPRLSRRAARATTATRPRASPKTRCSAAARAPLGASAQRGHEPSPVSENERGLLRNSRQPASCLTLRGPGPSAACPAIRGSGRLIWPQCGRLIWPHLRPIAVRPSALCRASKGSRGRDAIESGAVRADPQGP